MSLEKAPTRQLLAMLQSERHFGCSIYGTWECLCGESIETHNKNVRELKAELAKREHIPNKIEAKRIRQQKAIDRSNKKNKRYVNR